MSVPLKFAAGDSCLVKGERGRVLALSKTLATVQLGEFVLDVPIGELDIALPALPPEVDE